MDTVMKWMALCQAMMNSSLSCFFLKLRTIDFRRLYTVQPGPKNAINVIYHYSSSVAVKEHRAPNGYVLEEFTREKF